MLKYYTGHFIYLIAPLKTLNKNTKPVMIENWGTDQLVRMKFERKHMKSCGLAFKITTDIVD